MIRLSKISVAALVALAAGPGCTGDSRDSQQVSGKLALSSFPAPITAVRARSSDRTEVTVPVAVDGSFRLSLKAGHGYRIDFLAGDRAARLVFPRKAGGLDVTFDVRGAGQAVDVGAVRYLGDARRRTFVFAKTEEPAEGCAAVGETAEDGKVDAICVDDPAGEAGVGSACGEVGETGAGQAGEGAAGIGEAAEVDEGETGEMGVGESAVAEHNLPDSLGCEGEAGLTGSDESDGQGVGSPSTAK